MIDTKLLRQKILDLAIRGKLVPQDPNDEPASELLKKIKAEKEALIKAGKLKRDKHESFIFRGDDKRYYEQVDDKIVDITKEIPFDLPDGWAWCRLKNLCSLITDGTHQTPEYSGNGYVFLSSTNVTSGRIDWTNVKYIPEKLHQELYSKLRPQKGDILLAKNGTIGCAAIVDRQTVFDIYVSLALIRPYSVAVNVDYLHRIIGSPSIQLYFSGEKKGIGLYNLHLENIRNTPIPLPPLSEQKRIVTQIERLLQCVDEIDRESETLEKSIALAKQKILDLAIRGKLVPQDPKDEPASELLKKIKAEKEALIKAGKLKRDKHESFIFRGDDNCYYEQIDGKTVEITGGIPFEIPESWCWCRLGNLCDYGKCQSVEPSEIKASDWVLDLEDIEKDSGRLLCRIKKQNRLPTSSKHVFNKGNVLYSKLRTYLNKVLVADQAGYCTSEILPLDFGNYILPEFARCVLMSKMFLDYTARCGYGVKMPRLGTEDGRKALFPLPPMQEQARIIGAITQYESILKSLQE